MNREAGYVWQGFFLLLVILAGMGFVQLLVSVKPDKADIVVETLSSEQVTSSFSAPFYNPRGQWLFDQNCNTCHKLDRTDEMFNLPHIEDRIKDKQLLRGWIRNSDSVLKSGNRYFNDLYEKWNKTPMPPFPQLSDGDIDEILEYLWRHRK